MGFQGLVPGTSEGGFRCYRRTALKVPHPHAAPMMGVNKKSPLDEGASGIDRRWAKKERPH